LTFIDNFNINQLIFYLLFYKMENKNQKEEIQKTIHNPITKNMKPWVEALSSTIWKDWPKKIDQNQISTGLDKRENKIATKRKPKK